MTRCASTGVRVAAALSPPRAGCRPASAVIASRADAAPARTRAAAGRHRSWVMWAMITRRRGIEFPAEMPREPLGFDPIERAGQLWEHNWPDQPADVYAAMRAVTSIMRAQQILIAEL